MEFTWPAAVSIIGGFFAVAFAVVRIAQETKSNKAWEKADIDLEKRITRIEHVQRNMLKAFEELKSGVDVSSVEQRIATLESNQKNLTRRADELREGQGKLDTKIERLTDLMIKYLSEN